MQKKRIYSLFFLLVVKLSLGQNSFSFTQNITSKVNSGGAPPTAPINKMQLVKIVDSLLNLEFIDSREIELVSYYNTLISYSDSSKTVRLSDLNFYEDLDESIIFPPASDKDLSETLVLEIENEALSYFTAPRQGVAKVHTLATRAEQGMGPRQRDDDV